MITLREAWTPDAHSPRPDSESLAEIQAISPSPSRELMIPRKLEYANNYIDKINAVINLDSENP